MRQIVAVDILSSTWDTSSTVVIGVPLNCDDSELVRELIEVPSIGQTHYPTQRNIST